MTVRKKTVAFLLAITTAMGLLFNPSRILASERPSLQATSPVSVNDDRIASLWQVIPDTDGDARPQVRRICTASNVGKNYWLTAHHCVVHNLLMDGYIEQPDGQRAGIAGIRIISDSEDVALIKVGEGIDADPFEIAHVSLEVGQQAILTGYGATYDHASSAVTMITGRLDVQDFGSAIYTDLLEARSVTASRSCSGDSGAPIYIGNIIYGVHTAGGFNPTCTDGKNSLMWHTNIASRSDWITATIKDNAGLTEDEIRKAAAGLSTIPSPSPGSIGVDAQESESPAVVSSMLSSL